VCSLAGQVDTQRTSFSSGGLDEDIVKEFLPIVTFAIRLFLAPDAKGGPGDGGEALWTNFFFALDTDSEGPVLNPTESRLRVSQQARFAIKIAYCKFSLRSKLHFI
jgi:hypothetical protein